MLCLNVLFLGLKRFLKMVWILVQGECWGKQVELIHPKKQRENNFEIWDAKQPTPPPPPLLHTHTHNTHKHTRLIHPFSLSEQQDTGQHCEDMNAFNFGVHHSNQVSHALSKRVARAGIRWPTSLPWGFGLTFETSADQKPLWGLRHFFPV